MQTCVVHSAELHTGSGLPGTQGKKDDSGSYINDIIRQREVDWDGAPAAVRRSTEFQKTLSGSWRASSRGAEGCCEQYSQTLSLVLATRT